MSEAKVINARQAPNGWKKDPQYLYIGRPSYLGNPFVIGKDGNREEVIQKYREYLPTLQAQDPAMFEQYFDVCVAGSILVCWCKPAACHGDVLVEWLESGQYIRPNGDIVSPEMSEKRSVRELIQRSGIYLRSPKA